MYGLRWDFLYVQRFEIEPMAWVSVAVPVIVAFLDLESYVAELEFFQPTTLSNVPKLNLISRFPLVKVIVGHLGERIPSDLVRINARKCSSYLLLQSTIKTI